MIDNEGEFSVVQWFENGVYEYVRRNVDAETAVPVAIHYMTCIGARIGTTVRVMIEDGGGYCTLEWNRTDGITFPEELKGRCRMGILGKPPG